MPPRRAAFYAASICALLFSFAQADTAPSFSEDQLDLIHQRMVDLSVNSWEIGTMLQTSLEYNYPRYCVFSSDPADLASASPQDAIPIVWNITETILARKPADQLQLMQDGSSSDPASIGPAVLLVSQMQGDHADYMEAAAGQLQALQATPRSPSGAISHRVGYVQLWSDAVYMTPPFLAAFGLFTNNQSLLQEAYDQCRLYREALLSDEQLFQHVLLYDWQDEGLWTTGNAWAAAGMLRTAQTIARSQYGGQMAAQITDLQQWTVQLVSQAWRWRNPITGMLPNYLGEDPESDFSESAGTALMAGVTYRLAALGIDSSMIPYAEGARAALQSQVSSTGIILNVVNPIDWTVPGDNSPEGQSFFLVMHASWRDWVAATGQRVTSRKRTKRTFTRWQ